MKNIKEFINKIYDSITYFIFKVKDLFYWIPIIWKLAGSYSSYQALFMFMLKLRQVREGIEKSMLYVGDKQVVKRMLKFEHLLKRILQEDSIDYLTQYQKDGMLTKIIFEKPDKEGMIPIRFISPPDKECVLLKDTYSRTKHSQMLEKQDLELLGVYMVKYFGQWVN